MCCFRTGIRTAFNVDFFAGYSPERINPGDKEHTVEKF
jgi:UDP-N-acetyl-D-galactosamine dehydrogenase